MAEAEKEVAETNGKNPGTEPDVSELADLGASVGPGEDYDMVDEPDEEAEAKPEPPDPTKGMSPMEAREYWQKRAHHFESEYKVERTKRQSYDKQYGGLNGHGGGMRRAQEERAVADFALNEIPPEATDLKSYSRWLIGEAKKSFQAEMTEKQLDGRVESSEKAARDSHDGNDGLPAYDEMIDEYVAPLIQKRPEIFKMLRQLDDPAEGAYTLGFILKYKNFKDILQSNTRDELMKNINATSKQAASVRGKASNRSGNGGKLTKEEIENMTPEQFERELEKFRAGD